MLLIWYTPPRAGAMPPNRYYQEYYRRKYDTIKDDELTLLLLWYQLNNIESYKEFDDGKD